jgi:uncharacterized membrane protein
LQTLTYLRRPAAKLKVSLREVRQALNFGSYPVQMLVLGGYFLFVGFVAIAFASGLTAHDHYKRSLSRVNLIGCTAAATLVLLLLALVRSLV